MIFTERLQLVDIDETLWEAIFEGNQFLSIVLGANVPKKWTENMDAFPIFAKQVKENPDLVTWGAKLIILQADNLLIGTCGFRGKANEKGQVELGYEIKENLRGKGLATEAARGLIQFAWKDPAVKAVIAHTLPVKNASNHILQKLRFKFVEAVISEEDGEVWQWILERK